MSAISHTSTSLALLPANTDSLLMPTRLLDFHNLALATLIEARGWRQMSRHARVGAAYDFVRNEIAFGYNDADDIPASSVLADGFGQCNTKATLLMALLRGVGIRCRLHGFAIHKALQRGVVPELVYPVAPAEIVHSWVEVQMGDSWINLEGFIIDAPYIDAVRRALPGAERMCGYGIGSDCLTAPAVDWVGADTYIQKTGIVRDFGVFDSPDAFYREHRQAFGGLRGLMYRLVIRHWMNRRVKAIRAGRMTPVRARNHVHALEKA
jgi:Transglutaminase-like superfamily